MASAIARRSRVRTHSTLTVKPRRTAASASALSVAAGPYSVDDRDDHPDHVGRSGHQQAGRLVGPVAELADGRLHPQPGLLATLGWSFSTRETVWCETPASPATSVIAGSLTGLTTYNPKLLAGENISPGNNSTRGPRVRPRCCPRPSADCALRRAEPNCER